MANQGEQDQLIKDFRRRCFGEGFTPFHQELVDISIGREIPDEAEIDANSYMMTLK